MTFSKQNKSFRGVKKKKESRKQGDGQ